MKKCFTQAVNILKWSLKSFLFGIIILFLFNFIGSYFNLNIPINVFTLLIIGVLRIPGLVGIMIYTLI